MADQIPDFIDGDTNASNRIKAAWLNDVNDAVYRAAPLFCGTAGGTGNAITITAAPTPSAYHTGQIFRFKASATNSGATTAQVFGLSALAVQFEGAACSGNEIVSGSWYEIWYDGTLFQLKNLTRYRTLTASTSVVTPIVDSGSTGSLSLKTNNGTTGLAIVHNTGTIVNNFEFLGNVSGGGPILRVNGSDTNAPAQYYSKGTGLHRFSTFGPTTPQIQFEILHTLNAVSNITVTGGATGANASINVTGENLLFGSGSALATTATAGYVMFPSCAGTPTGVPTGQAAGKIPMIFDTTGVKLWFYTGGSWKGVVVA